MRALPHVLLVDRDREATELYRLGLQEAGFSVTAVADGQSLITEIDHPADAVVTEWEMFEFTGEEILMRLASTARMHGRPIFVLTNFITHVKDPTLAVARELGATQWLVKSSTTPSVLAAKVREALGQNTQSEPAGSTP